jgi:two-component sensor histidine kinase
MERELILRDQMKTKQLSDSDLFITPVRFGSSAWEHSLAPIRRALELLGRMSPTAATILAVVLVAVIAWFDYVTGDFSLALFYLVPVVLATWNAGRVTGWFTGVLSAAAWLVADAALSHPYGHPLLPYWNAAMLALIYGVVAHLLSLLHQLQAELQERVERRTASLAEVHHRVKNNLQIISSLLMLQAEKLSDAADRAVFDECRDRIYSMARLHEQLYSSGEFSDLDFAAHLREMAEMLVRSHTPKGCNLALVVRADPVAVDLDLAVTLGLIANELLLNALKHGFNGRPTGKVTVELYEGNCNQMTVGDDGCRFPPGFDARKSAGLGLELVLGMARQIRGEAKIENDPAGGTRTTIFFPSLLSSETATTEPQSKPTYHD